MTHHRAGLARILRGDEAISSPDDASVAALCDNLVAMGREGVPACPELNSREQAMLVYALKLTATPAAMVREDVALLRSAGLDDGEILDLNQVTAYFAYANRLVDGLGVELEFFHQPGQNADS